jgi:hypothetical protein
VARCPHAPGPTCNTGIRRGFLLPALKQRLPAPNELHAFAAAIAQSFPIVETLQWCGPGTGDVHSQESQHLRAADCSTRLGLIPYLVPQ